MAWGAWRGAVHRFAKSQTQLSDWTELNWLGDNALTYVCPLGKLIWWEIQDCQEKGYYESTERGHRRAKACSGLPRSQHCCTPCLYTSETDLGTNEGMGLLKVNGENRNYMTRRQMVPVPTSGNKKLNLLQNKNLTNIFVTFVQGKDATSFCENKSVKEVLTLHEVIPMLLQGKDDSARYPPLWPLRPLPDIWRTDPGPEGKEVWWAGRGSVFWGPAHSSAVISVLGGTPALQFPTKEGSR